MMVMSCRDGDARRDFSAKVEAEKLTYALEHRERKVLTMCPTPYSFFQSFLSVDTQISPVEGATFGWKILVANQPVSDNVCCIRQCHILIDWIAWHSQRTLWWTVWEGLGELELDAEVTAWAMGTERQASACFCMVSQDHGGRYGASSPSYGVPAVQDRKRAGPSEEAESVNTGGRASSGGCWKSGPREPRRLTRTLDPPDDVGDVAVVQDDPDPLGRASLELGELPDEPAVRWSRE